jgi:hypothetical protein
VVVRVQLDPQIVGVADVQDPAVSLLDRHAAVPERMTEKWNEQNTRRESEVDRTRLQAEPVLRRLRVRPPVRAVLEVDGQVAEMPPFDAVEFLLGDVYRRIGEIGEPPGVVGVAVGQHDVLHVGRVEAEGLDAPDRRVGFVELETDQFDQRPADPLFRIPAVQQTDPRINQRQPGLVFEQ